MDAFIMSESNEYTGFLRRALDGVVADSVELMKVAKADQESLRDSTLAQYEESNGAVTIRLRDLALLKIAAAMGVANDARESLDNGCLLDAALLTIVGQKAISAAAGDLLGISIGEGKEPLKRFAQSGANARHNMPGGAREKHRLIRNAWATGKYSSRDLCAEKEAEALGMSFSAARKALRGTPDRR